ncbi:MAG TPA: ATP-binding protein [Flavipsychrobacter sp.]|nr:ATP-binding protein [Flavipsychrobacter sp.]
MNERAVPNVIMDYSKIKEISIIGLLLLYKFIDYTYQNYCFKNPDMLVGDVIEDAWEKYEFEDLINRYILNKDITEQAYKKFKVKVDENFIIAPQPLLRSTQYSSESLKNEFLPKLHKYYNNNEKIVQMLFTCLSEVLLNFWEHAVDDNRSIVVADGTKTKIEIACADTGSGLISSLKGNPKYEKLPHEYILSKAFERGVTSKEKTHHMGYGLWIINEIVNRSKGKFHVYTEGFYYKNEYGKVKKGKCAYWKGTIIYIYLPLTKPTTFSDILKTTSPNLSSIKVNFL